MNSVGLPKGVQLRQREGGGNPSQRNYNITNDFVSVGIAQNDNVLLLWFTYCCCENETLFFTKLKIPNFCQL